MLTLRLRMENIPLSTRPAAVAGLFYPGSREGLAACVQELLDSAFPLETDGIPKALIAPHAGFVYSGPVAASAYARLPECSRQQIRRVILMGPSHRVPFMGIAIPDCEAFETPLGQVCLDRQALDLLSLHPGVIIDNEPHRHEHALEVQLPFLQTVLENFSVVPLCLGQTSPETVAAVLDRLWGNEDTLIVASSDLSHYHPYNVAQEIDRLSMAHIRQLAPDLTPEQACGSVAINSLLLAARSHGLKAVVHDLRNSGDTAGDRKRVVGYAAVSLIPTSTSPNKNH